MESGSTVTLDRPSRSSSVERRLRVLSGIQPSGDFHLGNYLGAVRNWVAQQDTHDSLFCIVDLHALSLPTTRDGLRANIHGLANMLLASGLDPRRAVIFVQSDVREHTELCWLLTSVTQFGELRRMTQFKEKTSSQGDAVSAALFVYPVLQAADILLYDPDLIPVGDDQRQHVELTRDVAERFNTRYGETFRLPMPDIRAEGARIMGLDDPTKKMSKSSANPNSYIALSDDPDTIRKKIRRAVTDSGSEVVASPEKPALGNLLTIYSLMSDRSIAQIEADYAGKGYGAFKSDLAEVIVTRLSPIQEKLADLSANQDIAPRILGDGAGRARAIAAAKMEIVRERIGLSFGDR